MATRSTTIASRGNRNPRDSTQFRVLMSMWSRSTGQKKDGRMLRGAEEAYWAHNPRVVGSKPTEAKGRSQ
jgi:hypothetical protein